MSLRDRLLNDSARGTRNRAQELYEIFGVGQNPFPPAGEPSGHPHKPTAAEDRINDAVLVFDRDRTSQVFIVEGTQGVGKTNLLSFFQIELRDAYRDVEGFYIIRYYPDPEGSFDGIIRRLFQEFAETAMLSRIGHELASRSVAERERVIDIAGGHEMRLILNSLVAAAGRSEEDLQECAGLSLEWLLGLRIVKRHKELLGVRFRLDTVESKTQALRDTVFCASELGLLRGIFLLLDELEKQDYSISKLMVLRYLSAIRALIDALPKHLFLLVALTKEARRRYFEMLPAFAGRLQNTIALNPLQGEKEAEELAGFYLEIAREQSRKEFEPRGIQSGVTSLLSSDEIKRQFAELLKISADEKGLEGVSQRDFLNSLHEFAEKKFLAGQSVAS